VKKPVIIINESVLIIEITVIVYLKDGNFFPGFIKFYPREKFLLGKRASNLTKDRVSDLNIRTCIC